MDIFELLNMKKKFWIILVKFKLDGRLSLLNSLKYDISLYFVLGIFEIVFGLV